MFKSKKLIFILIISVVGVAGSLIILKINLTKNSTLAPGENLPIKVAAQIPPTMAVSSDGKKTLTMKTDTVKGLTTYSFYADALVFSKEVDKSSSLSIPFNTWSPDDKYIFIKETNRDTSAFYVMSISGTLLSNGSKFVDIAQMFRDKYPDLKLEDVTGWASPLLLVVNSVPQNGDKGASFWFDLSSMSFIRLSDRFN